MEQSIERRQALAEIRQELLAEPPQVTPPPALVSFAAPTLRFCRLVNHVIAAGAREKVCIATTVAVCICGVNGTIKQGARYPQIRCLYRQLYEPDRSETILIEYTKSDQDGERKFICARFATPDTDCDELLAAIAFYGHGNVEVITVAPTAEDIAISVGGIHYSRVMASFRRAPRPDKVEKLTRAKSELSGDFPPPVIPRRNTQEQQPPPSAPDQSGVADRQLSLDEVEARAADEQKRSAPEVDTAVPRQQRSDDDSSSDGDSPPSSPRPPPPPLPPSQTAAKKKPLQTKFAFERLSGGVYKETSEDLLASARSEDDGQMPTPSPRRKKKKKRKLTEYDTQMLHRIVEDLSALRDDVADIKSPARLSEALSPELERVQRSYAHSQSPQPALLDTDSDLPDELVTESDSYVVSDDIAELQKEIGQPVRIPRAHREVPASPSKYRHDSAEGKGPRRPQLDIDGPLGISTLGPSVAAEVEAALLTLRDSYEGARQSSATTFDDRSPFVQDFEAMRSPLHTLCQTLLPLCRSSAFDTDTTHTSAPLPERTPSARVGPVTTTPSPAWATIHVIIPGAVDSHSPLAPRSAPPPAYRRVAELSSPIPALHFGTVAQFKAQSGGLVVPYEAVLTVCPGAHGRLPTFHDTTYSFRDEVQARTPPRTTRTAAGAMAGLASHTGQSSPHQPPTPPQRPATEFDGALSLTLATSTHGVILVFDDGIARDTWLRRLRDVVTTRLRLKQDLDRLQMMECL